MCRDSRYSRSKKNLSKYRTKTNFLAAAEQGVTSGVYLDGDYLR